MYYINTDWFSLLPHSPVFCESYFFLPLNIYIGSYYRAATCTVPIACFVGIYDFRGSSGEARGNTKWVRGSGKLIKGSGA